MNKIIKLCATALFALTLAACDKADPAAEFGTMMQFISQQQQTSQGLQDEVRQKLASADPAQNQQAITLIKEKTAQLSKDLDAINVKSPEIKGFKDKLKANMLMGNELLSDSLNLMQNPTVEAEQALRDKTAKLAQANQELQKLQVELQNKFLPATQPASK